MPSAAQRRSARPMRRSSSSSRTTAIAGTFDTNGFFGIGTTTPAAALAVNGSAYVTGSLTLGALNGVLKATNGLVSAAVPAPTTLLPPPAQASSTAMAQEASQARRSVRRSRSPAARSASSRERVPGRLPLLHRLECLQRQAGCARIHVSAREYGQYDQPRLRHHHFQYLGRARRRSRIPRSSPRSAQAP